MSLSNFAIIALNGYRSADNQNIEDLFTEYVTCKKRVVAEYEAAFCNIDKYNVFKHNRTNTIKISCK